MVRFSVQNCEVTKFLLVQCLFFPPSFCGFLKPTWLRWSLVEQAVHVTRPLRNISTVFSWNDALKFEEWIFGKERVFFSTFGLSWSEITMPGKAKVNSKHSYTAFHLCQTNTTTNRQLWYQHWQNLNGSLKKNKRIDVGLMCPRQPGGSRKSEEVTKRQ